MENNNINISSILSKGSLSPSMKTSVLDKFNNLIKIIEKIHKTSKITDIAIDEKLLNIEIKSTAKLIVKKSDKFQKDIVESTLKQKEESMEMLEISKLRLKAQIKDLEKRKNALTVKTTNSFFNTIKQNIFKLFNFNKSNSSKTSNLDDNLKNYSLKLSNYDLEKDKISKKFYENGSAKLTLLRRQTYYALSSSNILVTQDSLISIKEKIKNI